MADQLRIGGIRADPTSHPASLFLSVERRRGISEIGGAG